jgi:hypothetical protein
MSKYCMVYFVVFLAVIFIYTLYDDIICMGDKLYDVFANLT